MRYFHIYGISALFKETPDGVRAYVRTGEGYKWIKYNPYKNRRIYITITKFFKLDKVKRRMTKDSGYKEGYAALLKDAFYEELLGNKDEN